MGNRMSPLRRAIALDNIKTMQRILEEAGEGSEDLINEDYTSDCFFCCFRNDQSVLHTTMSYPSRNLEMVTLLIQYGADLDDRQSMGRTPLHRAGRQNNVRFAQLFVENGAKMDVQDAEGYYPIHSAILSPFGTKNNNVDCLEYFIRVGKPEDLQLKDKKGNTPLHIAAYLDFPAAVECLLRHGASMEEKNNLGKTPMDVSAKGCKAVMSKYKDQAPPNLRRLSF